MQNLLKKHSHSVKTDWLSEKYVTTHKNNSTSFQSVKAAAHTPSHLSRIGLLIISVCLYGVIFYLMQRIEPEKIKDVVVPNTYLPLLIATAVAHYFFFSFLFLKSRRGILVSLYLTLLLFLQLQEVLTWSIVLLCAIPPLMIELPLTFMERKG